jgi:hypothetical protein
LRPYELDKKSPVEVQQGTFLCGFNLLETAQSRVPKF